MASEALISAASIGGNLLLTWFNTKSNKKNQTMVTHLNNTVIVSILDDSHERDWKCVATAFIASTGILLVICLFLLVYCLLYRRRDRKSEDVV